MSSRPLSRVAKRSFTKFIVAHRRAKRNRRPKSLIGVIFIQGGLSQSNIYKETRNSTEPEKIQTCLHAGILPACYKGTSVSVEFQKNDERVLSCFALNDDGTVTCPMGNTLFIARKKGKQTYYSSKAACRFCINKCTQSKFKIVAFGPNTKYVPVRMNRCKERQLPPMPKGVKLLNNFFITGKTI